MQGSTLILYEYEDINSLLYKPIIATQRIKYTCIDVSTNHIILGSSSGSLYLFKREPCIFQQLIPLSEGTVTRVLISPDEKTIALSTKRGSVCVINLKPTVKLMSVSNEHLGETVTNLCWNTKSSEIYVGDSNGKISTIILSIFTVNGIFQPPSGALMHLDSNIVQIDFSSHYLLVSTLTRCYLCDTVQEQFKQIGNKARDGDFGACFMNYPPDPCKENLTHLNNEKPAIKSISLNSIISLNESNTSDENLVIFCARPGFRIWEVTVNGTVVKTHQFKDALALPPTKIYQSSNVKNLNVNQQNDKIIVNPILNFSRLFVIKKNYLFSYTSNGLYVIDPVNAAIILWSDELKNISSVQTIDDQIYIMTTTGKFHCLVFNSVENLILKLFEAKLYDDCLNSCMTFRSDLIKLVESSLENSDRILNSDHVQSNNIPSVLESVISVIQSNFNDPPKRLNSGIVVVNSGNSKLREENRFFNSSINNENINDDDSSEEIVCNNSVKMKKNLSPKKNKQEDINELVQTLSKVDLSKNHNDETSSNEIEIVTRNIQSDLQPIYETIGTLKDSITEEEIEEKIYKIYTMISDINLKYKSINELKTYLYEVLRSIERHYLHALLENISLEILEKTFKTHVLDETVKAFVDLNISTKSSKCLCAFPKLTEQVKEPKFLDVGLALIKRYSKDQNTDKCVRLCREVPYLWRDYLPMYISNKGCLPDDIIHLCLNTRDNIVISLILPLVNSTQWKSIVECIERMENEKCLLCNNDIDTKFSQKNVIDWGGVIFEIMKKKGTETAMTFLTLIEKNLPKINLKESLFQSLIFTKLLNRHGSNQIIKFDQNNIGDQEYSSACSTKAREELVGALEKDLEQPVNPNIFGSGAYHWGMKHRPKLSTCPSCTLLLNTPVLLGNNGISIFPCGHAYHVNCLIEKNITRCYLHSQKP